MAALRAILLCLAATGGGETVLLEFYSDTCPPCRQMAPAIDHLVAQGYAIRKVHVGRERELASRFGVGSIPCFVMLVDGREADRVVGSTSVERLRQMLALGDGRRAGRPAPIQWVGNQGSAPAALAIPAVRSSQPFSASDPPAALEVAPPRPVREIPAPARQMTLPDRPGGADASGALYAHLAAATVRLRIKDAGGQSCGSGTIIDARRGEALILTCGHLFRDSHGKGPIEVDLFGPTPAERIPGRLVHYDPERDLGLVSISTPGPVTVARLAPPGFQVAKGAKVIHVGCNNGGPPTPRNGQVTSLNRFLGPPNLEVSGVPVQGRSGGGLFTSDGLLIGVCNAAIPDDNEGLYAALEAIHAELAGTQLALVGNRTDAGASPGGGSALAGPPAMPKRMPPPEDLVRWTEVPPQPAPPAVAPDSGTSGGVTAEERAAWEELWRHAEAGAEVICIIRPRNRPAAESRVLVLDRASPAFLGKLAGSSLADKGVAGGPAGPPEEPGPEWRPRWLQPGYQGQ
jgi:thiol-disulfide isomerase/thioredoxin